MERLPKLKIDIQVRIKSNVKGRTTYLIGSLFPLSHFFSFSILVRLAHFIMLQVSFVSVSIFVYKMTCGFLLRQEYTANIAVNRTREGIAKVKS